MRITHLGHAGFCAEDDRTVVIVDPWLSRDGAFDSAWFQFPPNDHMRELVRSRLADSSRRRYLYLSHEHQDHFDIEYLRSLPERDFALVLPHFRRETLLEKLADYECAAVVPLRDRECIELPHGMLRLYLDDSELNRDSALLIEMSGRTFFNMNDCKLFDRLGEVRADAGHIDVFACQFSGATWHPTCYEYEPERYAAISRKKSFLKFESVARAIETLEPRMYLPSAGPACFLDSSLYHLNFEAMNTFPHADRLLAYLERRLRKRPTPSPEIGPGAIVEVGESVELIDSGTIVAEHDRERVIEAYAADRREEVTRRAREAHVDAARTLMRLRDEFTQKLAHCSLAERVTVPLYFRLAERPQLAVKVDFESMSVAITGEACEETFYELTAPAWQVDRVLDGALTWEEFSLTFRVRIRRDPDSYQPVLHAFLLLDGPDLSEWCEMTRAIQENRERVTVEYAGQQYSVLRYCPHQGGDLAQGWLEGNCLVCPRHRWHFDLTKHGQCTTNDTTIEAVATGEPAIAVNEVAS